MINKVLRLNGFLQNQTRLIREIFMSKMLTLDSINSVLRELMFIKIHILSNSHMNKNLHLTLVLTTPPSRLALLTA